MTRMESMRDMIERGENVDFRRVLILLALDQVVADEQYVAEALKRQEDADHEIQGYAG